MSGSGVPARALQPCHRPHAGGATAREDDAADEKSGEEEGHGAPLLAKGCSQGVSRILRQGWAWEQPSAVPAKAPWPQGLSKLTKPDRQTSYDPQHSESLLSCRDGNFM